jgi:hypothetical protein
MLGHPIPVDIAVAPDGAIYLLDGTGHLWASSAAAPTDFKQIPLPKAMSGRGAARCVAVGPTSVVYIVDELGRVWQSQGPGPQGFEHIALPKAIDQPHASSAL